MILVPVREHHEIDAVAWRARSTAVSVGPASRGPPSISTVLPVGDVTSAASPWPTEMKSMRSGAGGAAAAAAGVTTTAARSNEAKQPSHAPTLRSRGTRAQEI